MTGWPRILVEEWRYWSRSRLTLSALMLLVVIAIAAVINTQSRVDAEASARESMQSAAEEAFLSQPDRHPHRMVHYGHYVFRTPSPLAIIDPGVDPLTGTVMFLEGHRQNTATFPAAYTAPRVTGFDRLTPAFAYQVLVPLVLIVVGFSSVSRERELQTNVQLIAQGVDPGRVWLGKALALLVLSGIALLPLHVSAFGAIAAGESALAAGAMVIGYFLYLAFWSFAIVGISARARSGAMSLLWCCVAWTVIAVLMPRLAGDVAGTVSPVRGKIASDFELIAELRELGDGHNAADPAFDQFRARVFEEYGVDRAEDLPVNLRGLIAEESEARLTEVLNQFAERRMAEEVTQAQFARSGALLSPALAIRNVSMQTAGSDLENHHRFLREAEAARFEFVQGLNRAHGYELSYIDDINRNKDEDSWMRARVSKENWRVLQSFEFEPAPAADRVQAASGGLLVLLVWCFLAGGFGWFGIRDQGRAYEK
ncbi:MAG: DUF3526 domain-containing protein [Pseudomonadota bacterium]